MSLGLYGILKLAETDDPFDLSRKPKTDSSIDIFGGEQGRQNAQRSSATMAAQKGVQGLFKPKPQTAGLRTAVHTGTGPAKTQAEQVAFPDYIKGKEVTF